MAEFGMKDPVDPNLPPAGKPNGPNQGYSVLSYEWVPTNLFVCVCVYVCVCYISGVV